jgi:hypothetical protein
MKTKYFSVIILLFFAFNSFSQENFCECASYNSLQYKQNEYERVFPPDVIKRNGYKEVIVNIVGRERIDTSKGNKIMIRKPLIKEYREIKFLFNSEGYITSYYWYNRFGKPHSIHKFERNSFGKVTKDSFFYLDSLEVPDTKFGAEIQILKYDASNNLFQIKKLDFYNKEASDEKSCYTQYAYDSNGKVTKNYNHNYFDYNTSESTSTTETKYNESNFTSESTSGFDGAVYQTSKTTYNKLWKPIEEKTYDIKTKKLVATTSYKYDSKNNLISYFYNPVNGSPTECPETKGFLDLYTINSFGVIETLTHNFDNHTCEMTFLYKK